MNEIFFVRKHTIDKVPRNFTRSDGVEIFVNYAREYCGQGKNYVLGDCVNSRKFN